MLGPPVLPGSRSANGHLVYNAAARGRSLEPLLEAGLPACWRDPHSGATPLYIASKRGDVDNVRVLLQHGATADHVALTAAAMAGHAEVVRRLLAAGADPVQTLQSVSLPPQRRRAIAQSECVELIVAAAPAPPVPPALDLGSVGAGGSDFRGFFVSCPGGETMLAPLPDGETGPRPPSPSSSGASDAGSTNTTGWGGEAIRAWGGLSFGTASSQRRPRRRSRNLYESIGGYQIRIR